MGSRLVWLAGRCSDFVVVCTCVGCYREQIIAEVATRHYPQVDDVGLACRLSVRLQLRCQTARNFINPKKCDFVRHQSNTLAWQSFGHYGF